eukprot:GILI01027591.1.p1 GENE.GILI01027591.1~~GILI01027591.1.p1  ORF type:complete len:452 (+),score=105.86 GILI01027591.1:148-1356(+)
MARLPPETLEQHIYTLICSKTHKEEVIKARVQAVFDSIEAHAKANVLVAVIGKVLSGEVEESYILKHQQMEGVVYDNIHVAMLEREAQMKKVSEAASATNPSSDIPNQDGTLDEMQVKKIIDLTIPWPMDKRTRLLKAISAQMKRKELEPDRYIIHHEKLGAGILRFLLAERLAEVKPISEHFKSIDHDKVGVIDVSHFKHLLMAVFPSITARRAQQLAVSADPFDNNVVNFNTSVRVVEAFKVAGQQEANATVMKEVVGMKGNVLQQHGHRDVGVNQNMSPQPGVAGQVPPQYASQYPAGRISLQNPQQANIAANNAGPYDPQYKDAAPSGSVYQNQPTQQHFIQRSARSPPRQGSAPPSQPGSRQPSASNAIGSYPMPQFAATHQPHQQAAWPAPPRGAY